VVLAGDFNLYYPYWDYYNCLDRNAEHLLNLAAWWDLELRTPYGATTWAPQGRRQARPLTIDHIWALTGLRGFYYGIETRGRSDHYPQALEIPLGQP
jgi:endonuclease/exonuclease/phosphatase family metal-dependent hydrolase